VRIVAAGPFGRGGPPRATGAFATPLIDETGANRRRRLLRRSDSNGVPEPPPSIIVDGNVVHGRTRGGELCRKPLRLRVGTAFGTHLIRSEFLGGRTSSAARPNAIGGVAMWLLSGVIIVAAAAGLLALFSGRYITHAGGCARWST